jgi:hypothetical protein
MTRILVSTGEFSLRAQKRYDDTVLILAELLEHGYDSERGRAAMRIMNRVHGLYPIANEDFLSTLSTFMIERCAGTRASAGGPLGAGEARHVLLLARCRAADENQGHSARP